jgi:hypothetical protein
MMMLYHRVHTVLLIPLHGAPEPLRLHTGARRTGVFLNDFFSSCLLVCFYAHYRSVSSSRGQKVPLSMIPIGWRESKGNLSDGLSECKGVVLLATPRRDSHHHVSKSGVAQRRLCDANCAGLVCGYWGDSGVWRVRLEWSLENAIGMHTRTS